MMLILIIAFALLVAFVVLGFKIGWAKAVAAVTAFGSAVAGAVYALIQAFGGVPS